VPPSTGVAALSRRVVICGRKARTEADDGAHTTRERRGGARRFRVL